MILNTNSLSRLLPLDSHTASCVDSLWEFTPCKASALASCKSHLADSARSSGNLFRSSAAWSATASVWSSDGSSQSSWASR